MQQAHVTSGVVLNALRAHDEKAKQKGRASVPDKKYIEAEESAAELRRLEELADERVVLRNKLRESRPIRLALCCDRAYLLKYGNSLPRENQFLSWLETLIFSKFSCLSS